MALLRFIELRMGWLFEFGPDVGPVVGAKALASNGAARSFFDFGAPLNRHGTSACYPLANRWRLHPKQSSQGRKAANRFTGI